MATVEDVRWLGSSLERSYEVYIRGRLKFRVNQIVYVALSLDETEMGFAVKTAPAGSGSSAI